MDSFATTCPDLGSDHQAVHLRLALDDATPRARRRKRRQTRAHREPPRPNDPVFRHHLKRHLTTIIPPGGPRDT
eukprot:2255687-Pyramimonas_sp.AAC.1